MSAARDFGWWAIVRLGFVQTALGAIVVLTTSTLNRVMVVELALPALLPGLLVGIHYAMQSLRPRMGHGSDVGGRRTPWILGGMAVLALGGVGASGATVLMATHPVAGVASAVLAFALIGVGVSACGTSLLVLLAKRVAEPRRAAAATIVWLMMILGFALTAGIAGKLLDPYSPQRLRGVTAVVALIAMHPQRHERDAGNHQQARLEVLGLDLRQRNSDRQRLSHGRSHRPADHRADLGHPRFHVNLRLGDGGVALEDQIAPRIGQRSFQLPRLSLSEVERPAANAIAQRSLLRRHRHQRARVDLLARQMVLDDLASVDRRLRGKTNPHDQTPWKQEDRLVSRNLNLDSLFSPVCPPPPQRLPRRGPARLTPWPAAAG